MMTEEEFWAILHNAPAPLTAFYRVYYNDTGQLLFYSMEELPGKYIEIDQETFSRSPSNARVINGKLTYINYNDQVSKLVPSSDGTCCSVNDVTIVVGDKELHSKWNLKTYE